jgi:5-deoxy-D-glucuronate isomerase
MGNDKTDKIRKNSFSKQVCESFYQIAVDFRKHCEKNNLLDNNSASKELLGIITNDFDYSLVIIDEVQDYTQANLCLFKKLGLKLFCVGDALQMINPSYFSFGYLKNLLYEENLTEVIELKYNYRNSAEIVKIIDALGNINKAEFGTHSFVLKGQSVDNGIKTNALYVKDSNFVKAVASSSFDNFTFVVSSDKQKKELKKIIKNQEILTVSEIKGLERSTVVAYNILSDNFDKWKTLEHNKVNHKQADENSVYRYYYNLFYVGVSRAKQNIFVVENMAISQFVEFFKNNFDNKNSVEAIKVLGEIVSKVEFTQQEVVDRVYEFIKLGQFENARFTANKIKDDSLRIDSLRVIEVNENFVQYGKYREAGIKFWEYGLIDEAKKQFTLSQDTILIELIDKCSRNNNNDLNIDIIDYYEDVKDNKVACDFILETIKKDVLKLKNSFKNIKDKFSKGRK